MMTETFPSTYTHKTSDREWAHPDDLIINVINDVRIDLTAYIEADGTVKNLLSVESGHFWCASHVNIRGVGPI